MGQYVLGFPDIDHTQVGLVGGKGAGLGELLRIDGIRVPDGFCVTTAAYEQIVAGAGIDVLIERLSRLKSEDRNEIPELSAKIRGVVERVAMPADISAAVTQALAPFGANIAYAVRSSATAEDLPTASFAGQQDTFLNVVGALAVLEHISKCWASLFTERAVTYRLRNGFDHRNVRMAVVVQRMVFPKVAGILFTADPVTGNRKVSSIDASFGLGESLVSGLVNPDTYKVRDGRVIAHTIGAKKLAVVASPNGGTHEQTIEAAQQLLPTLTEQQAVRLATLGRKIETHFGRPQDIEWCLVGDNFHILQSRPITTLFPIPDAGDEENHVYLSVGHQQMMTDAFKPLGLSFWNLRTMRPMAIAGGRLFVDVSQNLATPAGRAGLMGMVGKSDQLTGDVLRTILDRGDFIPNKPDATPVARGLLPTGPSPIVTDATIAAELVEKNEAALEVMKKEIHAKTGSELVEFMLADIQELKRTLFDPKSMQVIMAGMEAAWWLNDNLATWLGEKNAADVLSQSVPNNVTSEMGLALLDVADVIRPHADVVAFLQRVDGDDFLNEFLKFAGGQEARDAIQSWLQRYGVRGVGEIDITRPRFSERPSMLVRIIVSNIKNFEHGEAARRFEEGKQAAWNKEQELLQRLRALPDGETMASETKRMIGRLRTFAGYREYPKYSMVSRDFVYKVKLMEEAERLVHAGVIRETDDIFFLSFPELQDVVRTQQVDEQLIQQRKDEYEFHRALRPPRVLTSEGECLNGSYHRENLPEGALLGLAVSSGTVEGRARVILDIANADLEPGDILVTTYTDPSWTPLFVAIAGLVTEVGGLMTHGAVIAREYGLPAVVGVARATELIQDGQRIRVHGTEGFVEMLS